MQEDAQEIALRALEQTRVGGEGEACLSEALVHLHQHATSAQQIYNGRELMLFESQPAKIGRLVDLLVQGNYRETAAKIVGISSRAIRMWMEKAEAGEERFEAVAQVIQIAEGLAEASAVRNVMAAGRHPQFWASSMTYLERKHPEKWGRRQDDQSGPKVQVIIGTGAGDVKVAVIADQAKSGDENGRSVPPTQTAVTARRCSISSAGAHR
jgi:hypothetical protein